MEHVLADDKRAAVRGAVRQLQSSLRQGGPPAVHAARGLLVAICDHGIDNATGNGVASILLEVVDISNRKVAALLEAVRMVAHALHAKHTMLDWDVVASVLLFSIAARASPVTHTDDGGDCGERRDREYQLRCYACCMCVPCHDTLH